MYAILKKRALIISSIICLLITWGCSNFLSEDEQLLRIEIYSIECCPLCKQAKEEIPKKLKSEFGDSVVIDIIDVDEKGNHKKFINVYKWKFIFIFLIKIVDRIN